MARWIYLFSALVIALGGYHWSLLDSFDNFSELKIASALPLILMLISGGGLWQIRKVDSRTEKIVIIFLLPVYYIYVVEDTISQVHCYKLDLFWFNLFCFASFLNFYLFLLEKRMFITGIATGTLLFLQITYFSWTCRHCLHYAIGLFHIIYRSPGW